jgi:hypothetical protein
MVILMTFFVILKKISQFVNCFSYVYGLFPHLGKELCEFMQIVKLPHY